jgi:dephospho-CoA kinase
LKLIGLTGGVGSGKSTVAAMLRDLGAVVVDADEAAHAVYEPGTAGFQAVIREFGAGYVHKGRIDRGQLGELVFHDADARHRLNAIVHPLVRDWMADRTAEAVERGATAVVQDVPLLYESGLQGLYEAVMVVYAPDEVQVRRLVDGRGFTEERARAMIASQMSIDEKRTRSQHVIDNSGTREETRSQVERIWGELAG